VKEWETGTWLFILDFMRGSAVRGCYAWVDRGYADGGGFMREDRVLKNGIIYKADELDMSYKHLFVTRK
jgi:hypothetical protein